MCIQGLGFVGMAKAIAAASSRNSLNEPSFNVFGVDLPHAEGRAKVHSLNSGEVPVASKDPKLEIALKEALRSGNLITTTDPSVFERADVTVVDVPFDIKEANGHLGLNVEAFRSAIRILGERMKPGSLIIIETTVPPGTCEKVVVPEIQLALKKRGLPENSILIAHSYERVMPGSDYLDSILNYWRVYAGSTPEAADACEAFLSKIINVKDFPLTRLSSMTASETAKVLENSYRAATIAFMEEWGRFAEAVGIDLFEVVDAIRRRPTHSNIRQPGFGVGGYCLTKDPLLAELGAKEYFGLDELKFPFCREAVRMNQTMPLVTLERIETLLGGDLSGKNILLMGISYRQDVGDTRFSPSETFVRNARQRGAKVLCHDPLVRYWTEMHEEISETVPALEGVDAVVFTVPHDEYKALDARHWLAGKRSLLIFDSNNVLSKKQRETFEAAGCAVHSIGRGKAS